MTLTIAEDTVVRAFHRLYYDGTAGKQRPYENTAWMGVPCLKCPMDLWAYQEILFEIRPDLIIETGTYMGGSALFFAHLCDLIGNGRVVSIDIEHQVRPQHPRITYLEGSSIAGPIVEKVRQLSRDARQVLVILDSDHAEAHVRQELELFAPLVTADSYLIVEDTNVNGHPVHAGFGPGPYEAVDAFLSTHREFSVDSGREKFYLTFNPRGFLKRTPAVVDASAESLAGSDCLEQGNRSDMTPELARKLLADKEQELEANRGELRRVNAAFVGAYGQLLDANDQIREAKDAIEGLNSTVAQLNGRNKELGGVTELLADRESRLASLEEQLAVARFEIARRAVRGWLDATDGAAAAAAGSVDAAAPVYEGKIDLRVKNNAHTIAYEFIADAAKGARLRVLEAGCGAGHFGEALRQTGHEVWGVEASSGAAVIARRRLDGVFLGTVEEFFDSGSARDLRFDCITFGDVLEHLVDPLAVLKRIGLNLVPDGIIVASIPNVAHLAARLMLLEGRWETGDRGILDRTHLHFFTKRAIADLFSAAGYRIEAIAPVRLPHELTGIAVDPELLRTAGAAITDDGADVFQYVVLARPATQSRPTAGNERFCAGNGRKVLCLMPVPEWSLGEIRLKNPLRKWAERHGGSVRLKFIEHCTDADRAWADVVVLQREANPSVLELIDNLHGLRKPVIFDLDDLLTEIPEFLTSYEYGRRGRPYLEKAIGLADAVTVTTARLRDRLLPMQASTFVVPNCPSPTGVVARQNDDARSPLTLLVASTDTVRVDFLIPALRLIAADRTLNVNIVGIGPPGKAIQDAGIPIRCVDNLPYEQFLLFVGGSENPVGLIPLDDSVFSGCKSPIKFFDYAMSGVVSVCSNVPPYTDIVEHGVTGILVDDNVESWCAAVKELANSPGTRQRLAAAARTYCADQFPLSRAADAWQSVFSGLGEPNVAVPRPPRPTTRDWLRLLCQPAAYRSGARILTREGWRGVRKRIDRLNG